MGKDYYAVLGLSRDASDRDIGRAYRKLSLKYHPEKNLSAGVRDKFTEIAESYDVLSDPKKKAIYDQHGEEGLKGGVPTSTGEFSEPYIFGDNSDDIFRNFFGTNNPYSDLFNFEEENASAGGNQFANSQMQPRKDPPIERDLPLSLDEIFHGCIKKMKISRKVLNDDMHTTSIKDKILTINVKQGWKEGTRISFPEDGDQGPNVVPADIIFIVKDKPHSHFKRSGNDLLHVADIPLSLALTGGTIEVPTIDQRVLHIPINEIIRPSSRKIIQGEGMPSSQDPTVRGDLVVEFSIQFPQSLSPQQKELIRQALH